VIASNLMVYLQGTVAVFLHSASINNA